MVTSLQINSNGSEINPNGSGKVVRFIRYFGGMKEVKDVNVLQINSNGHVSVKRIGAWVKCNWILLGFHKIKLEFG